MHVSSLSVDLHWILQFVFTVLILFLGLGYCLLKSTASKFFVVDANSDSIGSSSSSSETGANSGVSLMPGVSGDGGCAVCGNPTKKKCSGCKAVKYCSESCQSVHWRKEHKSKCKPSGWGKVFSGGWCSDQKQVDKILFPYDEFVKLFNWDKPGLRPCGLINCGNSCFANVVLQCLAHTRPLVAYLMDKGHRKECRRNEWCFLCELQCHLERASHQQPFSPVNILSRLPSIGGNLGYGKQEDAHEFMRFAIDTMQSICLDENGGEKLIHPKSQETTLIQHIFGGQLQSQVICTQCNQVSNQYENMMDLTVEIQGDAASLEECLDQFTVKEWLHGDNMYKCDGCNDYVKAWKRLTIRQAPNILTIALKRFQSGRFGKLNKKITFPEYLNLTPYMSEEGDHTDKYKLYGVVVHVDMLNASFFGHYICYIKDLQGTWYRIDDCKVATVELDDVLSQGAYMLLYSRISARPTCLKTFEDSKKQEKRNKSAMEPEQCCNGISTDMEQMSNGTSSVSAAGDIGFASNSSVPVEDPTSSPVAGHNQDQKDDNVNSFMHTPIEASSFISSPSEAHNITSESFTNGFHLESSCSQGVTSYEMQQVRNSIQLLEPGQNSEDIKSANPIPNSKEDESSLAMEQQGTASAMNGICKITSGSDSLNKSVLVQQSEPERFQYQLEVNGEPGRNCEDSVPSSSSSQSSALEEDESSVSLNSAACEMNGNCKLIAGSDSPKENVAAQLSESVRFQNEMEAGEINDPMILDDEMVAPEHGRPKMGIKEVTV